VAGCEQLPSGWTGIEHDMSPRESGRMKVVFFPGCLVLSIVLSVVGTVLLNIILRLLD
jgi:hypothetical protein